MLKVLLVFLLSLTLYFPKVAHAHSEVQVIEMTPNGFEPQEVTVDTNQAVIFLNKDQNPRWPASNTHPTHEVYPEFDPKKAIMVGASWAFKPAKAGEWKFHDHMYPHFRGVLTVVSEEIRENIGQTESTPEVSQRNESLIAKIRGAFSSFIVKVKNIFRSEDKSKKEANLPSIESFKKLSYAEQEGELRKISGEQSALKAWGYLKNVFEGESGTSGSIHDLTHFAGILLYDEKGFEGISDCTSNFAFGCYHGFLDKAFAKNLDHLVDAHEACLKLGPSGSGPAASCIHGIGHGIASFYTTVDLEKSLFTCRSLPSGNEYCFDGVFMEFVRSSANSFYKSDDPYFPCDSLEEKYGYSYSFACGRNQPSLLMGRFKMSFEQVSNICIGSQSRPFKEGCIDALSLSLAATLEPYGIIQGCSSLGAEFYENCLEKAAGELVFQDAPGWQGKTQTVCQSSPNVSGCLNYVNSLASQYGRSE